MLIHDRATPFQRRRTPEGFLQMRARIGRAGLHDYRAGEVGGPPGVAPDTAVRVYRPPGEVFDPASMASFAGKPITLDHPSAMVDSGNWRSVAVGHSGQGVVRDGDHVAADLVITDAAAVARAEDGSELSNGYWADFDFTPGLTPEGEPYDALQRNIRGNHIALVDQGRCGPSCTVAGDAAPSADAVMPMGDGAGPDGAALSRIAVGHSPSPASLHLETEQGSVGQPPQPCLVARLRADIEARDGEIAALKARAAADAASLDRRAAERIAVIDAARRILGPGFAAGGLDLDEIRRRAVTAVLGADAVRERGDAYVAAAFDTVAALRPSAAAPPVPDPLALQAAATAAPGRGASAALQARDAYLGTAWKSVPKTGEC